MFWVEVRAVLVGILCAVLGGVLGLGLYAGNLWMLCHCTLMLTVAGWLIVGLVGVVIARLIYHHFTTPPRDNPKPYPDPHFTFSVLLLVPLFFAAAIGAAQTRFGFLFVQTFPHAASLTALVILIGYGARQTEYALSDLMCGDEDDTLRCSGRAATCLTAAILSLIIVLLVLEFVAPGMGAAAR